MKQAVIEENLHFIRRIEDYQRERGVRRAEACREIGISEARLSDLRNGRAVVSKKFLKKIAEAEARIGLETDVTLANSAIASRPEDQTGRPGQKANMAYQRIKDAEQQLDKLFEDGATQVLQRLASARNQVGQAKKEMKEVVESLGWKVEAEPLPWMVAEDEAERPTRPNDEK